VSSQPYDAASESQPPAPGAIADPDRLAELRRLELLDTLPEDSFDRLTRLAARLLRAPVALVSLVDEHRQFFKSAVGLREPLASRRGTPLGDAICRIVVERGAPVVIDDTRADPATAGLGAVTELGMAAYAGVPLATRSGHILGSFCVASAAPRAWSAEEVETLRDLAAAVMTEIELRAELADRRHAEAALARSEQRLARAQALARTGSYEWDLRTNAVAWSAELYRVFGIDPGAPMSLERVLELMHPDDRDRLRASTERSCRGGGAFSEEFRIARPDGAVVIVEGHSEGIVEDGRVVRLEGTVQDVTERRQAEERLRGAHQMLAALVEGSSLAIVGVDADLIVTLWNPAAERLFGWTAEEVIGRPYPIVPEGKEEEMGRNRDAAFLEGRSLVDVELRRRRKDGSLVDVSFSNGVLRDAAGRVYGIVAFFADLTERKQLEERLAQAQKMEAVGQLAGGVAHDFNNLLTVIRGHCDLVLESGVGSEAREGIEEIRRAADRAGGLTRQLLAFSRKQLLRPRLLDLNVVVAGMERMLRRLIGEDVAIALRLAPALAPTLADPGQIEQVLLNLAVNARDAMPQGGTLTIETSDAVIAAALAHDDGIVLPGRYVMLRVTDTGLGMDEATRRRAFEPFFTTKGAGQGTGLGLATVFGIVRQSNGHIRVDSAPGAGTAFTLFLPTASGVVEESRTAGAPAAGGATGTILLVEDEAPVRALARRILSRAGYTVLEATDGADALRIARAHPGAIDLVLTDVVMPGMSGRELVEALRRERPIVAVLYMSGYTDDVIVRRSALNPRMVFVQKPFTAAELELAVRERMALLPRRPGAAD
jgi:PAS domain S-box-containing protein